MSFNYNPYKHIEIVMNGDYGVLLHWHCHGCGADSPRVFWMGTDIQQVVTDYHSHLLKSHGRTPEDFETWSTY